MSITNDEIHFSVPDMRGFLSVTVMVVRNGISEPSSNPGQKSVFFLNLFIQWCILYTEWYGLVLTRNVM